MPGHNPIVDETAKNQIIMLQPKNVVDAGCGSGFYGRLIKENLKGCRVVGIDIWEPYIEEFELYKIYDFVIAGDIKEMLEGGWNFMGAAVIYSDKNRVAGLESDDLIIFGDILEHMQKEDALRVVKLASKRFKFVMINSPIGFQPQGPSNSNPYESHLCGLSLSDFKEYDIIESREFLPEHAMFNVLIRGECNGQQ